MAMTCSSWYRFQCHRAAAIFLGLEVHVLASAGKSQQQDQGPAYEEDRDDGHLVDRLGYLLTLLLRPGSVGHQLFFSQPCGNGHDVEQGLRLVTDLCPREGVQPVGELGGDRTGKWPGLADIGRIVPGRSSGKSVVVRPTTISSDSSTR